MDGTHAHSTWRFYAEQARDRILAYSVELSGVEGGKVRSDLYELDYQAFSALIQKATMPAETVVITFPSGLKEFMPYDEFMRVDKRPYQKAEILYDVAQPDALRFLLQQEHTDRERSAKPADLKAHINELHTALIYDEAIRLTAAIAGKNTLDSQDKSFLALNCPPITPSLQTAGTPTGCLQAALSEPRQTAFQTARPERRFPVCPQRRTPRPASQKTSHP